MSDRINICEMHFPLLVLGYGRRLGIWVSGCNKNCKGCISPEFKKKSGYFSYSTSYLQSEIERLIFENRLNGITISGGEPFLQWKQLREIILPLREKFSDLDVLVFTGFKFNRKLNGFEKENQNYGEVQSEDKIWIENIKFDWLDILIDGEYREELTKKFPLRGSDNQKLHIFTQKGVLSMSRYFLHLQNSNKNGKMQVFKDKDSIFIAGIPERDDTIFINRTL